MLKPIVWIFLILASCFAAVHIFAMEVSLYWLFKGFDSVMHTWGGILITLGVYALSTFSRCTFKPSLHILVPLLLFMVISWEIFERLFGLYDTSRYVFDTSKDMILGVAAGLATHYFLQRSSNKTNNIHE